MRNFLFSILMFAFIFSNNFIFGQVFTGPDAERIISGSKMVRIEEGLSLPTFVEFSKGSEIPFSNFNNWFQKTFKISDEMGVLLLRTEFDELGQVHYRYNQTFNGIPVFDAVFIVHVMADKVLSFNGKFYSDIQLNNLQILSEEQALARALGNVNAQLYKWQVPGENEFLKQSTNNVDTTYFPKGTLVIVPSEVNLPGNHRISIMFNIYAEVPLSRAHYFIDAENGSLLFKNDIIRNADSIGVAVTKYSGIQTITSDFFSGSYRLRETGRGNGVETYNMLKGTNYSAAVDFTDSDNYWNNFNVNKDEIATDTHWGMEMTYDYFKNRFNRNSIDNNGFKLRSYVHYSTNYANAFWNGQFMTFGDGNATINPLVSVDIVGHEIAHGLTTFTADLIYSYESGALNEAFSDIFGNMIEYYAKPATASWNLGEDIGYIIRNMANPKAYGDPNCYLGQYYYIGTADNGGVHTNSGVLNYWFYLTSMGGSGTNDFGNPYNITGISRDSAAKIAYRMLTVYLSPNSQYADARFYAIKSALDLFGPCSPQVIAVTNAMYACGIGPAYIAGVQSNFSADITSFCITPATVTFKNKSNNATSFLWDFGDGITSTLENPTHVYNNFGTYNVKLIANGGSCGIDSLKINTFISINNSNPCIYKMPVNGNSSKITHCSGYLYDTGGPDPYPNSTKSKTTLAPFGASQITLSFISFEFEKGFDFLYIYDGYDETYPLIGIYDGNTLPNNGTIISTGGAITLIQETDAAQQMNGFLLFWQCAYPIEKPAVAFNVSDSISCSGVIKFSDKTTNGPHTWFWYFGDGNTSTIQNPVHTYLNSGIYNVKLVAYNLISSDSLTIQNMVTIDLPEKPLTANGVVCNSGSVTLTASVNKGKVFWFSSPTSTTYLDTGNTFLTPLLTSTTTFYAQNIFEKPILKVGKPTNGGGGGYLSVDHSLIFDVFKPGVLKSVLVYNQTAGSRTITMKSSTGATLSTITVTVPAGTSRVELNFPLVVGSNFILTGRDLYRNNAGVGYPYQIPGFISIKSSSASTNPGAFYYYFYDWEVKEEECKSNRYPVFAYINTQNPIPNFTYSSQDPTIFFTDNTTNAGVTFWHFGDGQTSTLQNPVHTYKNNGTYQVKLIVNNGCGIDSISKNVTIVATGIQNNSLENSYLVYPNPSTGKITIEYSSTENLISKSMIMNCLGQIVLTRNLVTTNGKNFETIDISGLSRGMYFVILKVGSNQFTKKIILK